MISIAVLLTCYNRKATTLRCLASLAEIKLPEAVTLKVYLVDDASPDETGKAVARSFPEVRLLNGSGSLFWGGGMRLAFGEAMKGAHDFYLWLNDDVDLFADAFIRLIDTYRNMVPRHGDLAIVVGACRDPRTGRTAYSGRTRRSWHPLRFEKIEPDVEKPLACETMNGNVVLISKAVVERIGNIDKRFTQQMGDLDYGLRAQHAGIAIWITSGFVGCCKPNTRVAAWKSAERTLGERLRIVNTPLGLPAGEWLAFSWRHGGILGVLMAFLGYREVLFPRRPGSFLGLKR